MAVRNKGFVERMESMGLGIIDPADGLGAMARLLREAATPSTTGPGSGIFASWQGTQLVANVFLWDNVIRTLPAVPAFFQDFVREAVLAAKKRPAVSATGQRGSAQQQSDSDAGAAKQRGKRRGKYARSGRAGASAAAQPAAEPDLEGQIAAVLEVVLSTMGNLGAVAGADQPFMEAGIDSLGECCGEQVRERGEGINVCGYS